MQRHLILPSRFSEHCVQRTQELIEELKFNEAHRDTASVPQCNCCPLLQEIHIVFIRKSLSAKLFKTASLHRTQPCDN